jgi:spore coat protein U-like protein
MLNGSTQLKYNLFQDATYSSIWGSVLWSYPTIGPPTIDIPLTAGGTGSATVTLYGRVYASQQTLAPGTYSSSFGAADVQIAYKQVGNQSCSQIGSSNAVAASFTVTANYAPSCTVAATTLNFGSTGFLSASIDGSSTLTPTCSASTPYTVALNGGNSGATDPTQRKMSSGGAQVTYGLYRDSARTLPWGSTAGVNTIAGTGSGFGQTLNVYGRVPSQTTPAPGTYSDTIIATITY